MRDICADMRDRVPVIQFDYAYVSSGDATGQQVRMRTILDTSSGCGTACVIDVKRAGDKYAISSAVSFLKELGFDAGRIPSQRSKHTWIPSSNVWRMIEPSSKFCKRRRFPRVTRVWVLWRDGTVFCSDKFEHCDWTLRRDLGRSLMLRFSECRGL